MNRFAFRFPYEKLNGDSKVIIYGAGQIGADLLRQAEQFGFCKILCNVDKNFSGINNWPGESYINRYVENPEILTTIDYDFVIVGCRQVFFESILCDIKKLGVPDEKIITLDYNNTLDISVFSGKGINKTSYGHISYSQVGQDMCILNLFNKLKIETASYIDIGAHHPYEISNTALMYEMGWRGINIEANPNLIEDFKKYRPEDINLNIGCGAKSGTLTFYMFDEASGINTFSKENADQTIERNPWLKIQETRELPVLTAKEIIDTYNNGVWPDFLDIDVEGLDKEIIESIDFKGEGPIVICAESAGTKVMRQKGYEVYAFMGDTIYLRKDIHERLLSK
jgi:FkbM family methyltransferase